MAISDSSKVDLLYKKLFGAAKSDTSTAKSLANELTASPSLLRADKIWAQSASIPSTPPGSTSSIVQVYTGTAADKCTPDTTTSIVNGSYVTWLTGLTDWITPEFGSQYFVKVYADLSTNTNPQSTGTQLDANDSGYEWWFDYQAGTLHFIGGTPPTILTGKVIWIVGYRYVGSFGLAASGFTGTLPVANGGTGVTTATGSGSNVQAVQPTFKDWISITTSGSGYNTYISLQNSIGNYSYLVPNSASSGANNFFLPAGAGTLIASNDLGTVSDSMLASGTTNAGVASKIVKTDSIGSIVATGNFSTATGSITASQGTITGRIFAASQELNLSAASQGGTGTAILTVYSNVGSGVQIKMTRNAGQLLCSGDTALFKITSAPTAVNTSATLASSDMLNGIVTSTTAAAVTMTLPSGTAIDTAITAGNYLPNGAATNQSWDWSVINTGATNSVTLSVSGVTGHTTVGNLVIGPTTSGRFTTRKTASATYVTYRIA